MSGDLPNSTASGAAVFGTLREQLGEAELDAERRYRARYPWEASLTVWVIDEPKRDRGVREIQIKTTDISRTGFGFVYRQYIHPGAMLRTRLDVLPGKPIVDGIVAYCYLTDDAQHRVGVQFVEAS